MNPQGGGGNNNQPPAANAALGEPNVAVSNPLSKLEGVVAAAHEAAAQTPKDQFANQFGETVPPVEPMATTPPPSSESAPDLMGQAPSNLETLKQTQPQPIVETLAQPEPEQTPAEILKQQIADSIDIFLEEVTKERAAV